MFFFFAIFAEYYRELLLIMTKANKVLFITQEITPYVPESEMANIGRNLPQAIQEKGREIRTFMPNGEISMNAGINSMR
ncbi:similar to glycogen synthase [Bacteroides pyogenes DSM 20611 = JCM 6294]|uniref:starch synthase n=1 Tax=Bacteroides pyogenes DSM 20611 = JCM 6294 TaxID=1121100 RepID=W4PFZ8_9BACE|nr:similar to glycogen synthase [Bacteroides pyogenes DSM 20611 = JCM 6294]